MYLKSFIQQEVLENYGEMLTLTEIDEIVEQVMEEWNQPGNVHKDLHSFITEICNDWFENVFLNYDLI
jgi:hypothetical protein